MKKKILCFGIGLILFFLSSVVLSTIMIDEQLAFQISAGICMIYFILLTFISYVKNLHRYFKTGEFPDSSSLAIWVVGLLTTQSNKNLGSSIVMVEGAYNSSKEFNKVNNKLGIFTYTLFYIGLWSFLGFVFYSFAFQPDGLTTISEVLLSIAFISIILAVFIILIFGIFANAKKTNTIMQNREKEYQQLKETNKLAYDLKAFKQHYGKPYYMLVYIGIIGVALFGLGLLYKEIFNNYAPTIITFPAGLIITFEVIYLPLFFPVIIHTMKMNSKRQIITLDPLKVKMVTKDGNDGYGTYEKVEKDYLIDAIETYQITNRYIIINGTIQSVIHKTEDNTTKEKNKIISQLKIPRVFNNENILIEYLENNIKNKNFQ